MSSCHKQPNNGGRVGVLVVDVVEMAVDGKLAEDEPNFRANEGRSQSGTLAHGLNGTWVLTDGTSVAKPA